MTCVVWGMKTELELLEEQSKITIEKTQIQSQITEINQRCCIRIPNDLFQDLQRRRLMLVGKVNKCERDLFQIKSDLSNIRHARSQHNANKPKLNARLTTDAIGKKWWDISNDESRSISERGLAALFCTDLGVIKKAIANHHEEAASELQTTK